MAKKSKAKKIDEKKLKMILTGVIAVVVVALVTVLIVLATMKNGLVTKGDDTYFYKNNKIQYGWQIVGNDKYYFDEDGKMHTGWLVVEHDAYYFRKGDGTLLSDTQATLQDLNGVYWFVKFNEFGKITRITIADVKYTEAGLEVPVDAVPNFGEGVTVGN